MKIFMVLSLLILGLDAHALESVLRPFTDQFNSYAVARYPDEAKFGPWEVIYGGYGRGAEVMKLTTTNKALQLQPQASTTPDQTHASLVCGPRFEAPYTLTVRSRTVKQLRKNSPANNWETDWIVFGYERKNIDDGNEESAPDPWYYFALKKKGWELGKTDLNYPGGQRYLKTGNTVSTKIGSWHIITVKVTPVTVGGQKAAQIIVAVDGATITSFVDRERPYLDGRPCLYNEDAHAQFDYVDVR